MNVGIILAAGSGQRFGSSIPKQFMSLNGLKVIEYSINAFKLSKTIDYIIIVTDEYSIDLCESYRVDKIVAGGTSRQESTYSHLEPT